MEKLKLKIIGEPKTIGELRKFIEKYPDETSFGFRNQPMQELREINNGEFIVFEQKENN